MIFARLLLFTGVFLCFTGGAYLFLAPAYVRWRDYKRLIKSCRKEVPHDA